MTAKHPYPLLARRAAEAHLSGRETSDELWADLSEAHGELAAFRRGCFVTIKTLDGGLRGCIGTIAPVRESLAREIMANAVSAATRDPRFPPMAAHELVGVKFSVDVLSPPEKVSGFDDLDPARWGVIVSRGLQRGLLLPDLEGVDTVETQVAIAARKAGLHSLDGVTLERFEVERHPEDEAGQ